MLFFFCFEFCNLYLYFLVILLLFVRVNKVWFWCFCVVEMVRIVMNLGWIWEVWDRGYVEGNKV